MALRYEDRIMRVLEYIHDNPDGDLSLDALADVAAMSRFHWHRVFRAVTGETCAQAVRRMRLHRASVWLVREETSLEEIAKKAGYASLNAFSRAFADAYGATPSAFRKSGRLFPPGRPLRIGEHPMYPTTTRTEPARRFIGLTHTGAFHEIGRSFEQFAALAQTRNLWPDLGQGIAIYFDNPEEVAEADLRSFAGCEFRGSEVPDGMVAHELAGGKTAVVTYKGPYSGLEAAYTALFGNWLPESGEEPADAPCYELYLNSPMDTAPEDLITEICLPLKG
jgi:AraC family transcriptional regulator